jgi:hypothetical protein
VIVGGSLAMRLRDDWHTMAHVMGGWSEKLARAEACTNVEAVTVRGVISGRETVRHSDERDGQLRLF